MKTSHIPYFVDNSQFVNCLWTDKNLSSKKQTFKKNAKYKLKNNLEKKLQQFASDYLTNNTNTCSESEIQIMLNVKVNHMTNLSSLIA